MTFLPIVGRELRVASRKRRTYWSRAAAGASAISIAGALILLAELEKGFLRQQLGPILFDTFKWLSFAFAGSAGVVLTSDCLSEEKREGTLGLLFLTDLRGYDVVLGKLLATSLRAGYGLLAAFPIIGLSFLLGGVTGGEFWRLTLLLCNTLLFSLAVGVFVSSVSREAQRAMNGTMALLVLFIVFLPGVDWWMAGWKSASFVPRLSWLSATFAFSETDAIRPGHFWTCMAIVHGIAWLFLGLASASAPATWQDKAAKPSSAVHRGALRSRFGAPGERAAGERARRLEENPAAWLSARDRRMGSLIRAVIASGVGLFLLVTLSTANLQGAGYGGGAIVGLMEMAFLVWLASQASRFFVEAKHNGALELLLVTPLRIEKIVAGHAWALRRTFWLPAVALLLLQAAIAGLQLATMIEAVTAPPAGRALVRYDFLTQHLLSSGFGLASFVTGLFAVGWFGIWMGLTSRKTNLAVIKTLVFVKVFPWMALMFVQMLLLLGVGMSTLGGLGMPMWMPAVITGVLGLGIDVFFIVLSRRKALTGFRGFAAEPDGSALRPAVRSARPSLTEVPAPPAIVP